MKKSIATLAACCFAACALAQPPEVEWAKAIGGAGNERANSVAIDSKGNLLLAGRFQSTSIALDHLTLTKTADDSPDVADIFIVKLDPSGKALWAVTAGGKGDDHATSCTTDHMDNVYVVGWFESRQLTFGGVGLVNKTEKGCDMYVAKFSPEGKCIWARNAGGMGASGDYSTIALDADNNVVVAGIAGNVMDFGDGVHFQLEKGGMYVAKYSNEGRLLWAKTAANVECQGVATDRENNIYAGGFFLKQASFGEVQITAHGETDACLVKYSPAGEVLWARHFGGAGGEIASCETDPFGNVYLAGLFFSPTIATPTDTLVNHGLINAFIAKFDRDGRQLWARAAGGNNGEGPATAIREFHTDHRGNALCTGSNWSAFSFAGDTIKTAANSEDILLLLYDKDGNELWGLDYGGAGRNAGRGVTTDKDGHIFLTGSFDERSLHLGGKVVANSGDSDIFIAKFRQGE